MTTIAYKDGLMASDSAASDDWQILTHKSQKVYRLGSGGLMGMSGDADARSILVLFNDCKTPKGLPAKKEIIKEETDFDAILVLPKGKIFHVWCNEPEEDGKPWHAGVMEIGEGFYAVGSGALFALSLLDAGQSARDAVLYACKRDFYSRPPVTAIPLVVKK
jgi:ATP-dependent protease HslVU (ClpYQ) peptidase subunit